MIKKVIVAAALALGVCALPAVAQADDMLVKKHHRHHHHHMMHHHHHMMHHHHCPKGKMCKM